MSWIGARHQCGFNEVADAVITCTASKHFDLGIVSYSLEHTFEACKGAMINDCAHEVIEISGITH